MIAPSATRRLTERLAETSARSAQPPAARPDVLTQHRREVLTLIGSGLSNAEVAGRLFLSEGTVKAHVSKILAERFVLTARSGLTDRMLIFSERLRTAD